MTAQNFSRPGAVDLSTLQPTGAAPAPTAPGAAAAGSGGATYSFDVTEEGFQTQVLEASLQHPVVLALWSSRAPQSREPVAALSRVVDSYEGRVTLARLDIDTSPQLAEALQVRAVPYVLAVLRGQPVPLFEGSVDDEAARQAVDQVVQAAVSNGITGRAEPVEEVAGSKDVDAPGSGDDDEPQVDPRFVEADAALQSGDTAAAVAAYQRMAEADPGDAEVATRLAQAELVARTTGLDPTAVRTQAAQRPDDQDVQLLAADLDLLGGHVDDAFDRVIEVVRRSAGDDRESARRHLLGLFAVVGPEDPRVTAARRGLANALF